MRAVRWCLVPAWPPAGVNPARWAVNGAQPTTALRRQYQPAQSYGGPKGDACDDVDEDHVVDAKDNCPQIYQWREEDWRDTDRDGQGDLCDDDLDGDRQPNAADNCPLIPNYNGFGGNGEDTTETSRGLPADGVGDACDLCPAVSSPDNNDLDGDGLANPCDQDDDNDAVCDVGGPLPGGAGGVPTAGCQPGKGSQNGQPADNCPSGRTMNRATSTTTASALSAMARRQSGWKASSTTTAPAIEFPAADENPDPGLPAVCRQLSARSF